jgi:hypothetical protein
MDLLSALPALLSRWLCRLVSPLDKRTAPRLLQLLVGLLFARGRRTVTSWFRPAGIRDEFRPAYRAVHAAGRRTDVMAFVVWATMVRPWLAGQTRLVFALDDTPTRRYGPHVEGAGIHRDPSPGPSNAPFLYGHVWVTLACLVTHLHWGTIALPLLARLYIRARDVPRLPPERGVTFRTKLEQAVQLLGWLKTWVQEGDQSVWLAIDGGYAKRPVLRQARAQKVTVVGRLPRNAALRSLPPTVRPKGKRGPMPTYGKHKISLVKRAGQQRGWQQLRSQQYGAERVKTIKTFLATWRPAGGVIRVVIVREKDGWHAFFCTEAQVSAAEVLSVAADRNALEQSFKNVKEVWGAGQQQLRNLHANVGAFHLNLWMQTLVEAWAWQRAEQELVDRSAAPWDQEPRRPSQADKRKALQREILAQEILAMSGQTGQPRGFRQRLESLVKLAAGT